jgi:CBS domain-containing protein
VKLLRDIGIRHLLTVDPHVTLRRAATVMSDRGVGSAVVIDSETVAGIITERDLLHCVAQGDDLDSKTVQEAMTRDVVSGEPAWDIVRAVRTMTEGGFRHLLVMEINEPVGIVSLRDLMAAMADLAELEQAPPD